jgi:hypothetical protein
MPDTGPVAAYLTEVKRDLTDGAVYPHRVMELHAPRLLAALEAVLGFCAEHENIRGIFGNLAEVPIPPSEIRRVIAVALLGEEPGT